MTNLNTDIIFESKAIPSWAKESGLTRCFVYRGPSMTPTLKPGCLLYVRPDTTNICPGDVIIFRNPSEKHFTVHRVVSFSKNQLTTRGDNNSRNDMFSITSDHIIGRVEMMEVNHVITPVNGGRKALLVAKLRWGLQKADRLFRRMFRSSYHFIGTSVIAQKLLNTFLSGKLKTIRLETPEGPLFKTTYKGHTVARWWPDMDRFDCKKPFELILRKKRPQIKRINAD